MELSKKPIDREQISISKEDILSLLGNGQEAGDQHASELIDRYISECLKLATPAGGYALLMAVQTNSRNCVQIEGIRFETGRVIRTMLSNAELYAFFVATAGSGPESLARELLASGEYLEGYIVDLIASSMVDSIAQQVHDGIAEWAERIGKQVTNRYSPGYCSWDVEEQQKLFSLMPEGYCGITLSDSSLMSPIKSISGIVGIGTGVGFQPYTCDICDMKNCLYRKSSA